MPERGSAPHPARGLAPWPPFVMVNRYAINHERAGKKGKAGG